MYLTLVYVSVFPFSCFFLTSSKLFSSSSSSSLSSSNSLKVLGTIFTVLRLDQQILWPWKLVLIPFAFPLFHALFSLLSYDLTRLCLGPEVHPNLNGTLGEHTGQGHALAHVFSLMRAFRIETYIVTTSIVASAVMIWYKISTQSLTLPWWAAVFPLALALFTLLLVRVVFVFGFFVFVFF